MAKKKDSKGKSAKPKKGAGEKSSKNLRQAGDLISSIVSSPMARELVADALIAVAGVLAGNRQSREAIAGAGAKAASGAKDLGQTATGAVAEVVADAARRILPSAMGGEDGGEAKGASKGGSGSGGRGAEAGSEAGNGRRRRKEPA
ncbi:MAG TPA: hypothetical protein VF601_11635 [Beijerinckiaceae bacterium]|jgi:hypothetical protein